MVTTGKNADLPGAGVVNSQIRRVSCEPIGNVYLHFAQPPVYQKDCVAVWPDKRPCFYFLAMNAYNVRGYGAIEEIWINGMFVEADKMIKKDIFLD